MKLKTSMEWCKQKEITILDPDGWRTNNIFNEQFKPCDFYKTKISEYEFFKRKIISTCMFKNTKENTI